MCDDVEKVDYLSQMLADNAVELHKLTAPGCTTIAAYPCGDHWHIGHDGLTAEARAKARTCKAEHPFYSPLARRMHKRKTHA
ncbi:hypothetical protein [Nocardioides sp.]|uniref:hypothetical protein n=1 Tax=Nocardioides sp. TaxID=35761 RepID=UPI0035B0C4C8